MRKTSMIVAAGTVLLAVPEGAASIGASGGVALAHRAQTPVQVGPFTSIEVRNSAHVVVRPASSRRVTLLKGSLRYTRVAVTDGVLVIDRCNVKCPRGYELEIEIQAPSVSRISLANGGWIRSVGSFGPQRDLAAAVSHGGTIDVRSMAVDRVTASVQQGGRILAAPRGWLFASVAQGGAIHYWGNAQVRSSVQHGGVVIKGSPDDINLPLALHLRALPPRAPLIAKLVLGDAPNHRVEILISHMGAQHSKPGADLVSYLLESCVWCRHPLSSRA